MHHAPSAKSTRPDVSSAPSPLFRGRSLPAVLAAAVVLATLAMAEVASAGTGWRDNTGAFGSFTLPDKPKGSVSGVSYTGSGGGRLYARFATVKCPGCGTAFTGYWVEPSSGQKCKTQRHGSYYWGRLSWRFNDAYTKFNGKWGYCDGPKNRSARGGRR